MYQLLKLRELGFSVKVYETAGDVGGTWYWNRYPGCRFDSESYSYGYSFSKELLQEWDWSEHFSPQPETLRYLNRVADKFDLRKDIQFDSRVKKATYKEADTQWEVELEDGSSARAQFLISATGPLSAPQMPNIEGTDSYQGESFHTARWPRDPDGFGGSKAIDFKGKRVGVIGTGASGVQVIQEIAKTADELFVFQRHPNWCAPLKNGPVSAEEQAQIKASYPEILKRCSETFGSFLHSPDPRKAVETSAEDREALFEKLYGERGFGIALANFRDIMVDPKANVMVSEYIEKKIRQRVNDPLIADKLVPTNHGFGTRRVPLETHYYEVYNQANVTLVDLSETPIERVTPKGVQTTGQEYELDMLIYATGFDPVTGALNRIDISGLGGQKLKRKWADGPQTYLGMQAQGFPNLLTLVGPHNGATLCNIPRCIEQNVEWVSDLLDYMRNKELSYIEPTQQAENDWTEHVAETAARTLFPTADSWFMGVNTNNPERKPSFMLYAGGVPRYKAKCDEVAEKAYEGFVLK
ncbi:MAG: NAD(P)/FAD-dependent oxidoreductase [Gammaproteobacteria bacterium]|nr:NAD(P)/FAD-dependent oxidoreductase [Gammaproteobacteria bacterium]MBQ0838537.1 NAD(P)/FAD-dependent oxidoreductase [Gammaproteobacteria bacterium]